MKKEYYVYILSNVSKTIYVGMTGDLFARTFQHKQKKEEGFSSRYNLHKLVYYEIYNDVYAAIAREKQIKRWRREKKVALIESVNPKWKDLAEDWY